ncbi:putative RNA-directed DNA polymerase [Helianthus annuus]|nr:putative RNA-directed DNA polymerase [Helianthus annuus]
MSCTSPWDWSLDSRNNQELVTAADWAKSMVPQPSISPSQWALVSNQSQSLQNLLISESETGSNNRPPKLNHMNDFPSWKNRFHTYVQGQSTDLWTCFINAFNTNLETAASTSEGYANMLENDKKAYELEKKAFATLTQALNKDIYHQFSYCKSTKALWDALVARGEGNAAARKSRHDLLKKEFESFQFLENETLNDMITRFYHLISEMCAYGVVATQQEMVSRFADALPPKWSSFIELLKHTGTLDQVNIYEFIQKLEHKNDEEIRKARRAPAPQNTEMYLPGFDVLARSAAAQQQQPKLQTAFVSNTSSSSFPFPQSTAAPSQPQFDPRSYIPVPTQPQPQPQQQQQQAHYTSNPQPQPQSHHTIRVDNSNLSHLSIEVAKEHMEIINTMVSAYCGLVAGQLGNINMTNEDYDQIDKEEMELMDIKWAFASAVRRAKDFMARTGRTSLEGKKNTKYGFDINAVTCFNCGEKGHFKRECTRPIKHGNHNPFRNQTNVNAQQENRERRMVAVNNNQGQPGTTNHNRALAVQADEGCDWSVQFGEGDQGSGTALYAKVIEQVHKEESSGSDDSSGYSGSSDEEGSVSGDNHSEPDVNEEGEDIQDLLNEADELKCQKSILIRKAAATSTEMEKLFSEDGAFSFQTAFMANGSASTSQVNSEPPAPSICKSCADMKLESEKLHSHNQSLVIELSKCKEANMALTRNEKDFKEVIETLKKNVSEVNKVVYHKQVSINEYINTVEETKKQLAIAKSEHDAIKQKLDSYSNSRFVLDHIIDVQQLKGNQKGIGYKKCPPPVMNNYTKMPDEEEMPRYEPSVPLDFEEFTTGLGFKPDSSSNTSEKQQEASTSMDQSSPIIEDCETSDDEPEVDVSEQDNSLNKMKGVVIPIENHILCDPDTPAVSSVEKQVTDPVKVEKKAVSTVKSSNVLYTLVGDSKIYSDHVFPIKNVNKSLIDKVFEDNTNKFLGKTLPGIVVTQCDPIPKSEIRKQFRNQKSPTTLQPSASKGKQPINRAQKPETTRARVQKKEKDVKFVSSKGTDKIETFENKSNTDFVKQVTILKRNSDNNYTQHTNGCDEKASTSGSTTSTSCGQSRSPKLVERRKCFKCGTIGHIIRNCPSIPKQKFVEKVPPETTHPQRRSVSPKNNKQTVKEQETKRRHKNMKTVEKVLKTEVKTVQKEPSMSQPAKPESSKSGDKGGYITGEGSISNGIVCFDKINYVKQIDHNLLSVSQICDKKFSVIFDDAGCYVLKPGFKIPQEWILLSAPRVNDLYILDMSQAITTSAQVTCFVSKATEKESIFWHRRMGHIHLRKMNHLVKNNLVNGVPVRSFHLQDICVSCQKGKQTKKSHPLKKINTVSMPLERLHMDLFGPMKHKTTFGDAYCLVVTDDYSRFSWVSFMAHKSETPGILKDLLTMLENLYTLKVKRIRSDNGTEFKNQVMDEFCTSKGILHEYSSRYTPQQNGVAERKNRTIIETARTMLVESELPIQFWGEAVSAACYTLNRVLTVKRHGKTCFELLQRRKPDLSYLEPFGAPCTMIEPDGKFGARAIEGFFLGYATPNFRVWNLATKKIELWSEVRVQRYTSPVRAPGDPWMFDYDGLFDSFNLPTFDEESAAARMLLESDNAAVSPLVRPIVVDPQASTSVNNMVQNEVYEDAADYNDSSEDDEYHDAAEGSSAPAAPVQGASVDTPHMQNVDTAEGNASTSTHIPGVELVVDLNLNNLGINARVPDNPEMRIHDTHPQQNIIGDVHRGVQTRNQLRNNRNAGLYSAIRESGQQNDWSFACYVSQEEPKSWKEALKDSAWVEAMQEELQQFHKLGVWKLVEKPENYKKIGTRWVFKCKKDDRGVVIRNKARLVVQGFRQIEGIDYNEVYAPVARLEAIRIFLAYASFKGFKVYQMDVKSAFLHGVVEEEIYVEQPPGFEDPVHPDRVWLLNKALYGLHQAPRAWYATLSTYLLENGFRRGLIDCTLFIKEQDGDLLLVQRIMQDKFEMSAMGEMNFFLGLQVQQTESGIFIHQTKYVGDILSRFQMSDATPIGTPLPTNHGITPDLKGEPVSPSYYRAMIGSLMYLTASRPDIMYPTCLLARYQVNPKASHLAAVKRIFRYLKAYPDTGLWYPRDNNFDLVAFSDSDFGGCKIDGKSTTAGCQFLGNRLVTWQCKKQTCVATSTCEAEYIAASSCCSQVLWIQQQLRDYGFEFLTTPIYVDNSAALDITKNPVQHSKTKHIEIKYHFIRDCFEKRLIDVVKVHTDDQRADLFTKAFDKSRFDFLLLVNGIKVKQE